MENTNIRLSLHLNDYFTDYRRISRIFIAENIKTIKDLEYHIANTFNLEKTFYLTCNNHFLPSTEDIRLLSNDDIVVARQANSKLHPPTEQNFNSVSRKLYVENTIPELPSKIFSKDNSLNDIEDESTSVEDNNHVRKRHFKLKCDTQIKPVKSSKKKKQRDTEISKIISSDTEDLICLQDEPVKKKKKKNILEVENYNEFNNKSSCEKKKKNNEEIMEKENPVLHDDKKKFKKETDEHNDLSDPFIIVNSKSAINSNLNDLITKPTEHKKSIQILSNETIPKNTIPVKDMLSKKLYQLNELIDFQKNKLLQQSLKSKTDEDKKDSISNIDDSELCFDFVHKRKRIRKRKNKTKEENKVEHIPTFRPPKTKASPLMHLKFSVDDDDGSSMQNLFNEDKYEKNSYDEHMPEIISETSTNESGNQYNKHINGHVNNCNVQTKEFYQNFIKHFNSSYFKVLTDIPEPKSNIIFQILKMSENYSPVVSNYIIAQIKNVNDITVKLELLFGNEEFSEPRGRFSCYNEEESDEIEEQFPSEVTLSWNLILEPRLVEFK